MDAFRTDGTLGTSDIRTNNITLGSKFLLPFWRVQPYLILGFGAQHSNLDFRSGRLILVKDDTSRSWNTALRPALGLDIYVTQHILIDLELAAVFVTGKFENEDISISDPIYLSGGIGFQYRF